MTREDFIAQLQAKAAAHTECQADDGEHQCYDGQWTVHGCHDYEVIRANWRGGGKGIIHCPGKTPDTILGASARGPAYGVNPESGEKILSWTDSQGNPQG